MLLCFAQVLFIRGEFSAYYSSPYLDVHGEEDPGLKRKRPLHLSVARYLALQQLWAAHEVSSHCGVVVSLSSSSRP